MTHFIQWKNTQQGLLEADLRQFYFLVTDETIQEFPNKNADDTWRMVGSSRLDEEKIAQILDVATQRLEYFKVNGLAEPEDTLDMYIKITTYFPEEFEVEDAGD
jgi:hypothetical protein